MVNGFCPIFQKHARRLIVYSMLALDMNVCMWCPMMTWHPIHCIFLFFYQHSCYRPQINQNSDQDKVVTGGDADDCQKSITWNTRVA